MSLKDTLPTLPLGFGAAPLGNMFRDIPDLEAAATVDAAWRQGTRYFDTAPFYGAGLSEIRLGRALGNKIVNDYTADATLRSIDDTRALQRLMPAAAQNVDIVVGGPYSSGVLAGGTHFEYQPASAEILAKVERIKTLAARHRVPIKAAALQFSLANRAVAAVIPGASRPERLAEDHAALTAPIPAEFWRALREQRLVAAAAPLPIDD